ncbi:alpha-2-macroglobulin-like protein 1 [Aulostomus maculatus]
MAPVLQMFAVLLASAVLQTATSAHLNDTTFAVLVSSKLKRGKQETLCAQISGPTEPVSLTIALNMDSGSTVILEEEDIKQDFYRCLTFQVPLVRYKTVANINVTMKGESTSMSKKTKILILPQSFIHIIQTDKPIYKPGQAVQFRIVSLDDRFMSVQRLYKVVELQDPNSNRIAQWLDRTVIGGILDLSHVMIPEATQGKYTIKATTDEGEEIFHNFEVQEYVLPKYEIKVQLPSVITILDQEATVKICGKYTYGKPVVGAVKAVLCRHAIRFYWYLGTIQNDLCKTYKMTTDKTGCATQTVNLTDFSLTQSMYDDDFEVDAELEEFGTGVILKGTGYTSFSSHIRTVVFEDVPAAYKPGIPFEGKVKVSGPDNKPVASEPVYVLAYAGGTQNITLTTDLKGMASFSLDTSSWKGDVNLRASSRLKEDDEPYIRGLRRPEYRSAYHHVAAFYSKSSSFVKLMQVNRKIPCDKDATVRAQYIIQGKELKDGQDNLDFFYMVMSRGEVMHHGRLPVAVKTGIVNKGEVSVSLQQVTDLAPFAQVLVYIVMPSGEFVGDSKDFPIQLCLKNKVSLRFSSLQELPAEKTTLKLQAHPGSMCSIRAIDQSVLLLQAEQELTVKSIYNKLPEQRQSGFYSEVEDMEPYPCFPFPDPEPEPEAEPEMLVDVDSDGRSKRSFYYEPPNQKDDFYSILKEIGVKIVTNADVKKPHNCQDIHFRLYDEGMVDSPIPMAFNMPDVLSNNVVVVKKGKETVRTFFPETWIWDLVSVGDTGSVDILKTVPDTITKWAAGAFCVSPVGFGVSPNTGLTAFQPFFVSLTLPYSVIRGEVFTLKATVFNYLSKCIMVKVTLADSEQYSFRNCDDCQYRVCLCSDESRTFKWIVTPNTLGEVKLKVSAEALKTDLMCGNEVAAVPDAGQIDTVVRTLLVQVTGGTRHWVRAETSKKGLDSLEVEMTSYVLLALATSPILPDFSLDYSSAIVRWLTEQQNPYGGFSSTQDTVVALQALSKYAAATYSEEGSTTVTVTSLGGLNKEFNVDQSNRLLYQEEKLQDVPGEYTVRAEGQSCVLAQISMHYNIPPPPDFSAFNISTNTMAKCNTSRPQLILFVHVRYQGRREETNMVIINIKLLSGYILDKSSLQLLKNDRSVKRVDVEEGFINIYLDGLKKSETVMYSVTLEEDVPVRNLKPAVVKVYDYYQTSDEAVTEYISPCAESDGVNEL